MGCLRLPITTALPHQPQNLYFALTGEELQQHKHSKQQVITMKQTFEELFLAIVQDGGQVTVGDKTFNVTLSGVAKETEPMLTVPENVEFVTWFGGIALRYNGLILSPYAQGNNFSLSNARELGGKPESPLQLAPCKISEMQNGDWFVYNHWIDNPCAYMLLTEKGAVSFGGHNSNPIYIQPLNNGGWSEEGWLKVVQG